LRKAKSVPFRQSIPSRLHRATGHAAAEAYDSSSSMAVLLYGGIERLDVSVAIVNGFTCKGVSLGHAR
jgi:hypothetical protein